MNKYSLSILHTNTNDFIKIHNNLPGPQTNTHSIAFGLKHKEMIDLQQFKKRITKIVKTLENLNK